MREQLRELTKGPPAAYSKGARREGLNTSALRGQGRGYHTAAAFAALGQPTVFTEPDVWWVRPPHDLYAGSDDLVVNSHPIGREYSKINSGTWWASGAPVVQRLFEALRDAMLLLGQLPNLGPLANQKAFGFLMLCFTGKPCKFSETKGSPKQADFFHPRIQQHDGWTRLNSLLLDRGFSLAELRWRWSPIGAVLSTMYFGGATQDAF
eukprot:gene27460-8125_t